MILRSLRLQSFRAHGETCVAFAPKVNLLFGPNGAGKTNVLEAIHYLCLTKSFLSSKDTVVLRKGGPYFEVEGHFEGERRPRLEVRLVYVPGEGKKVFINGAPLDRLADVVGQLPVVAFSPEDYVLTAGGPDERRRFVNNILSQARPVYMDDLMKYQRARRQRNELLRQYRRRRTPPPTEVLDSWTQELVALGSRVVAGRQRFVKAFAGYLEEAYAQIEAVTEKPSLAYQTIGNLPPEADAEAAAAVFREALARTARREQERGRTLVGPQRDELVFRLGDLPVRDYGSQGQHRTFGMALKLAQYFYLRDQVEEKPLLLLDDAFGKLDEGRARAFLALLQSDVVGQSFLTDTRRRLFTPVVPFDEAAHRLLRVRPAGGEVTVAAEQPVKAGS